MNDFPQTLIVVVICTVSVAILSLVVALFFKRSPANRHWVLLTGLLCTLFVPLFALSYAASGVSTTRLALLPVEEPSDANDQYVPPTSPVVPAAELVTPTIVPPATEVVSALGDLEPNPEETPTAAMIPPPIEPIEPEALAAEVAEQPQPDQRETQAATSVASPTASFEMPPFWALIWMTGTFLLMCRVLAGWLQLRRIRSSVEPTTIPDAVKREALRLVGVENLPAVGVSKMVRVPIVSGWRSPLIVLPQGLSDRLTGNQLADVLAHETAHVVRRDQVVLWLQQAARCLLWPIVPVHFLNRALGRAREEICDNFVLKRRDALQYGETLLRLAELAGGVKPLPAAMGVLHWRGELETRIGGLISEARKRTTRPKRGLAAIVVVGFLGLTAFASGTVLVGNESEPILVEPTVSQENPDALIWGTVLGPNGNGMPNAKVVLMGGPGDARVRFGEAISGDDGAFAFKGLPDQSEVFANSGSLQLWCRTETAIAFASFYNRTKPQVLRLLPTANLEIRLVDEKGRGISNVKASVTTLYSKAFTANSHVTGYVEPWMKDQLRVTSDADGRLVFKGVPASGAVSLEMSAEEICDYTVYCNVSKPNTIKLSRGATVNGKVQWPDTVSMPQDGKPIGKVTARSSFSFDASGKPATETTNMSIAIHSWAEAAIQPDGTFKLDAVPAGQQIVSYQFENHIPLAAQAAPTLTVRTGEPISNFTLTCVQATRITGRVVSFENKQPIADVKLQLWTIKDGSARPGVQTTTDKDGRYIVHVSPGEYRIKPLRAPEQFIPGGDLWGGHAEERFPKMKVTESTEWPDLELDPATDVTLNVVDEDGNPVPDAVVKIVALAGYPAKEQYGVVQRTDAHGQYIARRVTKNDTLPICVYTRDAISEPDLVVTPEELDGPVTVELSSKYGFRFRCKVVDTDGKPVSNAKISIGTTFPYVSKWLEKQSGLAISGGMPFVTTNAEGIAVTGPLWPGRSYRISASAEGYGKAESPQTGGGQDGIVDLTPLVLKKVRTTLVTGRVVDQNGEPISGVRIVSAGKETWKMATATTRSDGNFRLDDVAPDVRYVFADAKGHRLGGARVVRQKPVTIRLRSNSSSPVSVRAVRAVDRDEQLKLAADIIGKAWALPMDPRTTSRIAPLEAMIAIDRDFAYAMSEAAGGQFDYVLRCREASDLIREKPDEAIKLLQKKPNWKTLATALSLAKELGTSSDDRHREIAAELADVAAVQAENYRPAQNFPSVAKLYTFLGNNEKAKEFRQRSLKKLKQSKDKSRLAFLSSRVATAIAHSDYEKARELAMRSEEGWARTRALADVAISIADSDPDKAIREIDALTGDSNAPGIRDKSRLRIALKLAGSNPEEAIALVRRCEETGNKAQALGRLAVVIAKQNKEQAWQLIDEALSFHRSEVNPYRSWSNYGEGGPFAAALAYQAKQCDYPDMESVVWHVLATCRAKTSSHDYQGRLRATIITAKILALVDKIAARDLLNSVASQKSQIPRGMGNVSLYDQWMQAWFLVDMRQGIRLVSEDLDRIAATKKENALRYGHGSVFRLLVAKPGERYDIVTADGTGLWELDR